MTYCCIQRVLLVDIDTFYGLSATLAGVGGYTSWVVQTAGTVMI